MSPVPSFLFQALADQLPLGITIFELISREELDFRMVYVNEKRCQMAGFDMKPFIGQTLRSISPAAYEGPQLFPMTMLKALDYKSEVYMGLETLVDPKLGPVVYDLSFSYVADNYVAAIVKTVEQEKSLSQELSLKMQMLAHGEETSQMGSWMLNMDSGELKFTRAYLNLHEYGPGEINPQNAFKQKLKRIHPDDRSRMEEFRYKNFDELPQTIDYRYLAKNGDIRWFRNTIGIKLKNGNLIGTTQDITQHKLARVELERALKFQQKLLNTSPGIIYVNDVIERKSIFTSGAIYDQLGYTATELRDMGERLLFTLTHPNDHEKIDQHYTETLPKLKDGEVIKTLARYRHKQSGEYIWQESTESIFERDESGRVLSIVGITKNVQQEIASRKLAKETNKELEQLIYSVSHDLRAPIRHIESFIQVVLEEEKEGLSSEGKNLLERGISSAQRLGEMTDELLNYAKTRNREPQKSIINVSEVVSTLIESFTHANPQQKISWQIHHLPHCYGDIKMMETVWENLISNAIKYSSREEVSRIEIKSQETDEAFVYSIHDNGAGFNPKFANKLFTVFQRLHKRAEFPGHGIGLANVARIIHQHQGKVWAEGTLGEGASFYFSIPKNFQFQE